MYRLGMCTMVNRVYAHEMARILNPDGVCFGPGDVVSRSDFTEEGKKGGLAVVCRGNERTTVTLDDAVAVWEKRQLGNLIPKPGRYPYFDHRKRKLGGLREKSLQRRGKTRPPSITCVEFS